MMGNYEGAAMDPDETPLETRANWTITERTDLVNRVKIPEPEVHHPRRITNKRGELLAEAERIVNGARNVQYGDPNDDFKSTAALWTTHLLRVEKRTGAAWQLEPHDVAIMMILLKVSRLGWSPEKADHWLDVAGYAACGYDCSDAQLGGDA
jgi:hypothetical protein